MAESAPVPPLYLEDLFSVRGRTVLVTGGSRGIGEMIAAAFVANGATVYVSSRNADQSEATATRLATTYQGTCIAIPSDLATFDGVSALATVMAERTDHLDILVNNAAATWGAPVDDYPEEGWDKVMATNVKAVFFLIQQLLPLLEAGSTHEAPSKVINIGSIDGMRTSVFENYAYSASKAALHALTRQLAMALVGRNVLVNGIAPGMFPTKMLSAGVGGRDVAGTDWEAVGATIPRRRVGTPEDIAGAALFLASRAADYVVGEVLVCDGGIVAS